MFIPTDSTPDVIEKNDIIHDIWFEQYLATIGRSSERLQPWTGNGQNKNLLEYSEGDHEDDHMDENDNIEEDDNTDEEDDIDEEYEDDEYEEELSELNEQSISFVHENALSQPRKLELDKEMDFNGFDSTELKVTSEYIEMIQSIKVSKQRSKSKNNDKYENIFLEKVHPDQFFQNINTNINYVVTNNIITNTNIKPLNIYRQYAYSDDKTTFDPLRHFQLPITSTESDFGIAMNKVDALRNFDRNEGLGKGLYTEADDSIIESFNPMFAVYNQPSGRYPRETTLKVESLTMRHTRFRVHPNVHRSNLSATYFHDGLKLLIVARDHIVEFYDVSNYHSDIDEIRVGEVHLEDTHDFLESDEDYMAYIINYLGVETFKNDNDELKYCLVVGNDNKEVIVLEMDELIAAISDPNFEIPTDVNQRRKENKDGLFFHVYNEELMNDFIYQFKGSFIDKYLRTNDSVWCVKVCNNIIFASNNEMKLHAFYEKDGRIIHIESVKLNHNIPYLDAKFDENLNEILISCVTYKHTLFTFKFVNDEFVMIDNTALNSAAWSCLILEDEDFLKVHSVTELCGEFSKYVIDVNKIAIQSRLLHHEPENDSLGIGALMNHTNVQNLKLMKFFHKNPIVSDSTEQVARRRRFYDEIYASELRYKNNIQDSYFTKIKKQKYILASTKCNAGLFTFDHLLNISSCIDVFPIVGRPDIIRRSGSAKCSEYDREFGLEFDIRDTPSRMPSFLNRIYLVVHMKSINAIAYATQFGQVAIFRLTDYHGMKSFRLEHVLIDTLRVMLGRRTIIGLSAAVSGYDNVGNEEWTLFVVLSDYFQISYKITKNTESEKLNIFSVL